MGRGVHHALVEEADVVVVERSLSSACVLQQRVKGGPLALVAIATADPRAVERQTEQVVFKLGLVLQVATRFAALGLEERRLRDVEVPALDQVAHLSIEERQQERADVRPVDVGVGHDDDLVVPRLVRVEVFADPGTESGDDRLDLRARQHAVDPRSLDVQDLAANRENRLGLTRSALLRGSTSRITLDDEELTLGRVALLAVRELARQAEIGEGALASRQVPGLSGRFTSAGRVDDLRDDRLRDPRILFEVARQLLVDDSLDRAPDLAGP